MSIFSQACADFIAMSTEFINGHSEIKLGFLSCPTEIFDGDRPEFNASTIKLERPVVVGMNDTVALMSQRATVLQQSPDFLEQISAIGQNYLGDALQ